MATNIGKALYPAPAGIDEGADPLTPEDVGGEEMPDGELEIDIVNPDMVTLDDGSVEITIMPGEDAEDEFGANLADIMDASELTMLASELVGLIDADINSRKDWVEAYVKGLEVLGMKYDERTEPWTGACGVYSTVLTEAAIRFQAEMATETFPAQGPVKTQIIGAIDKLK